MTATLFNPIFYTQSDDAGWLGFLLAIVIVAIVVVALTYIVEKFLRREK